MNTWKKILSITVILVIISLALPGKALAAEPKKVIVGGTYTLHSGETLTEDLLVIGGTATLEADSRLNGSIMVLGGSLTVSGQVSGYITVTGGMVYLTNTAVIQGDVTSIGAQLSRDPQAVIKGSVRTESDTPFALINGGFKGFTPGPGGFSLPNIQMDFNPFFQAGWFLLKAILWALVAMLLVMFLATQTGRIAHTIVTQPLFAGGLGLVTVVIAPLILIGLIITICLIPVALVGILILVLAWAFGLIALGMELGQRFGRIFKQEWHPALSAGLGTLLLILVLNGMSALVPCIGWIPQALAGMLGLGAVLLTRFGTAAYPPELPAQQPPLPVEQPAPPAGS